LGTKVKIGKETVSLVGGFLLGVTNFLQLGGCTTEKGEMRGGSMGRGTEEFEDPQSFTTTNTLH